MRDSEACDRVICKDAFIASSAQLTCEHDRQRQRADISRRQLVSLQIAHRSGQHKLALQRQEPEQIAKPARFHGPEGARRDVKFARMYSDKRPADSSVSITIQGRWHRPAARNIVAVTGLI